jgi:hypothetical protein
MTRQVAPAAVIDERRIKIAKLWRDGRTVKVIAARLGVTEHVVNGDVVRLQATGEIEKRRTYSRRARLVVDAYAGLSQREIDRLRKAEAYARDLAGHANAKRVVTIADSGGEMRVTKYFATPDAARTEPLSAVIWHRSGRVTGDEIYGIERSNGHKRWALIESSAA